MIMLTVATGLARRAPSMNMARSIVVPSKIPFSNGESAGHVRSFAKQAASQKTEEIGYWEQKKAAKDRRRELYQNKQERIQRLKVRRHGRPHREKAHTFNNFFLKKKVDEEYMNRKARQAGLDWKIETSVIVKRINVVLPDKEKWEADYDYLRDYLDQFGKMYPKEIVGDEKYEIQQPMTDEEMIAEVPFTLSPRETEADANGDVRTSDRKLKDNLYLVVQDGPDELWQFPKVQIDPKGDETFVKAAERAVLEKVGTTVETWCTTNCPWSVKMTAFPPEKQQETGCYGVKNFYMLVEYDEGTVSTEEMTVKDFAWLDREEITERVKEQQGELPSKFYHYLL